MESGGGKKKEMGEKSLDGDDDKLFVSEGRRISVRSFCGKGRMMGGGEGEGGWSVAQLVIVPLHESEWLWCVPVWNRA